MLRPPLASSLTALAPLVALIICGGCSSATETEPCLAINSSLALVVKVTDARSDAYIASGATLKWRQGTRQGTGTLYVTSQTPDASPFLVGGAPGTYDILVEKQGYAPYSQSVVVPGNRCGPLAVELTAKLVPLQ